MSEEKDIYGLEAIAQKAISNLAAEADKLRPELPRFEAAVLPMIMGQIQIARNPLEKMNRIAQVNCAIDDYAKLLSEVCVYSGNDGGFSAYDTHAFVTAQLPERISGGNHYSVDRSLQTLAQAGFARKTDFKRRVMAFTETMRASDVALDAESRGEMHANALYKGTPHDISQLMPVYESTEEGQKALTELNGADYKVKINVKWYDVNLFELQANLLGHNCRLIFTPTFCKEDIDGVIKFVDDDIALLRRIAEASLTPEQEIRLPFEKWGRYKPIIAKDLVSGRAVTELDVCEYKLLQLGFVLQDGNPENPANRNLYTYRIAPSGRKALAQHKEEVWKRG